MEIFADYRKYRWFFTSSRKLVVGGKSAMQNDELLRRVASFGNDFIVMHTSDPGSPFSIILGEVEKVNKDDIEECAIFTGCFSRAWREGKKKTSIDIFKYSQLHKSKSMKQGTWGVINEIQRMSVNLELVLTRQKGVIRAVPERSVNSKKDALIKICPGEISREDIITKLDIELDQSLHEEELLSALPAGGIKVCKNKK